MRLGARPCFFQQSDQQSLGGFGIAAGLDDLVDYVTVLVNGTPKPVFFDGCKTISWHAPENSDRLPITVIGALQPFADLPHGSW
jgi:hypothetical protein